MKTTPKLLRAAERELEARRSKADALKKNCRETAYAKCPALLQLDAEISRTGLAIGGALGKSPEEAEALLAILREQNAHARIEREKLLLANRFPKDYLETHFTCELCRDTGFVNGLRCGCFTRLLRQLAYKELCMDAPLEKSTFARFHAEEIPANIVENGISAREHMRGVVANCEQYAAVFDEKAKNILFTGQTGLGKTHLSLAIVGEVLQKGYTVIYGAAQNLLNKMEREHFSRYNDAQGETEEALISCTLLVLDDLGSEFFTKFTESAVYNIINTRLLRALPTIISTNLTHKQLEEKYGRRVSSRVFGNYIEINLMGKDHRQKSW
jgi:DNA replication protein DnaC